MKCSELKLSDSLIDSYKVTNGEIHIFKNYLVLEINEGITVNFDNFADIVKYINVHYHDGRPYGIISNRINSYSIDLSEAYKFQKIKFLPAAKAIVSYSKNTDKLFALESHFCPTKHAKFNSFYEAEKWILNEVRLKNNLLTA